IPVCTVLLSAFCCIRIHVPLRLVFLSRHSPGGHELYWNACTSSAGGAYLCILLGFNGKSACKWPLAPASVARIRRKSRQEHPNFSRNGNAPLPARRGVVLCFAGPGGVT